MILYAICEKEGYNKWITLSTLSLSQCWVRKTIDQFLHVIAESVEFQKDWPRVFSQKNVRESPVAFLLDSRRALLELFSHRIGRRAMFWCLVECREVLSTAWSRSIAQIGPQRGQIRSRNCHDRLCFIIWFSKNRSELAAWRTAMTTDIPMNVLFCRVVLLDRFLFGLWV